MVPIVPDPVASEPKLDPEPNELVEPELKLELENPEDPEDPDPLPFPAPNPMTVLSRY